MVRLREAVECLSGGEKNFLQQHEIQIKPVRRLEDIKPGIDRKLAGMYDPTEKTIYIPEEVWSFGEWRPNNDVLFQVRHEFGHAYNAKAHPLGDWLSDVPEYRKAFRRDFDMLSLEQLDELRLSSKYKPLPLARDEVFADAYAHSTGLESNNPYSQKIKQAFPRCLQYLKELK